ncbi:ABC transporter permease subunit [Mangrovicoccus algicola]|uniref:ABC transporter permease subunit n=1 Tax=Mangrovicoccus algicola TaxID=2771008 RepID=A0A8J6Z120_9RHOB|nr:ABC transporter permease subunit [Mangrovicoccus algicola]MBE3639531.1 ABC transporter permease subunit [Mangrovicoccus algicola]
MKRWIGPVLATPVTAWLLLAFAAPLAVVVLLSLHEYPSPFGPVLVHPSLIQFRTILSDGFYMSIIAETVALGLAVTVVSAILGYPLAHWLARMPGRWRALAFAVILIPLLTNVVVRSLGIMLLLSPKGLLNSAAGLIGLGPFEGMLFTHGAVIVALAQVFMPFMVLALYDNLQNTSPRIHEAAESLGASPAVRFLTVDFPLSLPGLRSGIIVVFLMTVTSYVSATLLGGKKVWTIGMLVMQEAIQNLNATMASALSLVMTVVGLGFIALVTLALGRFMTWRKGVPARPMDVPMPLARIVDLAGPLLSRIALACAIGLLLLPLGLVVVQSFNDVPLATAAGFKGFTLEWYRRVLVAGDYTANFLISVKLAFASVVTGLILALPAGFALARHPFRGRGTLLAFWMLPLSLPGIAIAVGMLKLLQIYLAVPPFIGLMAVHVVVILPFMITLLTTSVMALDPALEEASASLGANAVRTFVHVTLPSLAPGLFAAGLVGFLMSFGEVTVTAFLTTARLTTLPVRIYSEATFALEPTAHAISALLIGVTIIALGVLGRFVRLDRLYSR